MKKLNSITLAMGASIFLTIPNFALSQETNTSGSEEDVERINVTGSRIIRDANISSGAPIQSIDSEEIRLSGEFNVTDVLNDVPALFSSQSTASSNDGRFAAGANILNLRGLGANRTLVLVDGKRHVGGSQGSAAVDIGSIPVNLIKNVEVLTGGASAVYGADAVTGVVNFILMDDFEGFEFSAQGGQSSEGDTGQINLSALYGDSYANGDGNFVVSVEYGNSDGLKAGERDGGIFVGSGRDWLNPAKRFQNGDITNDMPNFQRFFNPANDRSSYGLAIPGSADAFIASFTDSFGSAPTLTDAELALIANASAAPERAILPGRTFPFTSGYGIVAPGNGFTFGGFDPNTPIDLNDNGIPDCYDSSVGYQSVFGAESFGAIGGCWTIQPDGTYRVVQDGLVSSAGQGFGGDAFDTIQREESYLIPAEEKLTVNLLTTYEYKDLVFKGELKYYRQEVEDNAHPTSFWDLVLGAPDNPYLPDFLQDTATAAGGVSVTVDPIYLGTGAIEQKRETFRVVGSVEGDLDNGWFYTVSALYNEFSREQTQYNAVINDRFFAATDAVTDPATGQPACRSQVDPTAPAATTPFNIPAYDAGYYSFTPGDGTCVPLNIWGGRNGVTQEALDFVTTTETDEITLKQTVISATLAGDFDDYFSAPAGAILFAAGVEYRKEESEAIFDDLQRGVIPQGSPFPAGTLLSAVSENESLTFRPQISVFNETGEYDVYEVFGELSIPLLDGEFLADELTLDLAARYSDYSTVGDTTTWLARVVWAPHEDFRIRYNLSEAIRAPNITELFGPRVGTTFRPADPCDAAQISAIGADNPELAAATQSNCVAYFNSIGFNGYETEGVYDFTDPLTAAFGGIRGGNPNLMEETAETTSVGFVYTPQYLDGFTLSVDYWDIKIDDAINEVGGQTIADGCFQNLGGLNPNFCGLLGRNATNGGFNFLESTSVNFVSRETAGVDFSANYDFAIDDHEFDIRISGTKVNKLDDFTNPLDPTAVDDELGEILRPEWAGNIYLSWEYDAISVTLQNQYIGEQLLRYAEIDTFRSLYGNSIMMDDTWTHDISVSYELDENVLISGGINNITDETPFITEYAYPASAVGRFYFIGVTYRD